MMKYVQFIVLICFVTSSLVKGSDVDIKIAETVAQNFMNEMRTDRSNLIDNVQVENENNIVVLYIEALENYIKQN